MKKIQSNDLGLFVPFNRTAFLPNLTHWSAALVVIIFLIFTSSAKAQLTQQELQQRLKVVFPKVGHSVARVEVANGPQSLVLSGFTAGQSNWVVTMGENISDKAEAKVLFKHTDYFEVARVRYRDKKTKLVVLELATDPTRTPLTISSVDAKPKATCLLFSPPEKAAVNFGLAMPVGPSKRTLTEFQIQMGTGEVGTPFIDLESGEVVGVSVSTSGNTMRVLGPAEIQRVVDAAVDPEAAIAAELAEAEKSKRAAAERKTAPQLRVWKARSGTYSTRARYLQQKAGKVQLEQPDKKKIVVDISILSDADQEYLREQL